MIQTLKRWSSRLLGGAGIGALATVADFLVLTCLVELARLSPALANVPALLVGAVVQFAGCRYLVFRARQGSLTRQLAGFCVTELGTLLLNGLAFHLLVTLTPIPYPIARVAGTFLVFVCFSFPLWALVFRARPRATGP